jgi:hypothetical protein
MASEKEPINHFAQRSSQDITIQTFPIAGPRLPATRDVRPRTTLGRRGNSGKPANRFPEAKISIDIQEFGWVNHSFIADVDASILLAQYRIVNRNPRWSNIPSVVGHIISDNPIHIPSLLRVCLMAECRISIQAEGEL